MGHGLLLAAVLPVLVPIRLKDQFMAHKKHLDAVVPDLMRSPLLSAGEKVRLVLFSANPSAFYGAATAWGRLTAKRKGK